MTAVSGWWTADHAAANASMVVAWPLCIMLEKSRCLARLSEHSPAWQRTGNGTGHFFFELHDYADCLWAPRVYSRDDHRHNKRCLEPEKEPFHRHHHFQNHGSVPGDVDGSYGFNARKDIVTPTSNALQPGLPRTDAANITLLLAAFDEAGGIEASTKNRRYLMTYIRGSKYPHRMSVMEQLTKRTGRGVPTTACRRRICQYGALCSAVPHRRLPLQRPPPGPSKCDFD